MADTPTDFRDVAAYYSLGLERDRLTAGAGLLEYVRTRAVLERYLPHAPAVVADVGGGPGRYAYWLTGRGYAVHLVDPVPLHVEQARAAVKAGATLASAEVGDARALHLEDPAFAAVAARDRGTGRHSNPTGDPAYFTTAYFHRPDELATDCADAGLEHQVTLGVEGPAWLLGDLEAHLGDDARRAVLLDALAAIEAEPALLGASAHLLAVAHRA